MPKPKDVEKLKEVVGEVRQLLEKEGGRGGGEDPLQRVKRLLEEGGYGYAYLELLMYINVYRHMYIICFFWTFTPKFFFGGLKEVSKQEPDNFFKLSSSFFVF